MPSKSPEEHPLVVEEGGKGKPVQSLVPLFGEIMAFSTLGILIFTILLSLKLSGVISWSYWLVCSPLWLILLTLLALTQSRKLTSHAPLIIRLAWLLCVACVIAFLILVNMDLEHEMKTNFDYTFVPLWALFGITFFLGMSAVIVACAASNNEKRRRKYCLSALPLLLFDTVFFPFLLLLELKLGYVGVDMSWSSVMIPLWITDAVFLCGSVILLVFTIGAPKDAFFSLSQLITFVCVLPASTAFKILLVLLLDGEIMSIYIVMIPALVVELLLLACGLNIRFNRRDDS